MPPSPALKHKAFAYITHGRRLLVFSHPDHPQAGIQVPAGTLKDGEDPREGVLREAFEETGLEGLRAEALPGQCDYPAPARNEIHRRNFFHLTCSDDPPEKWIHYERHPDEGDEDAIRFEFFWVDLPGGVPTLSPGHDRMIPKLLKALELA